MVYELINVSELIGDPDFTQPNGVNVIRRKVRVENHKQVITEQNLNVVGIITIADDTSIEMQEYADNSSEVIHVFTYLPLYTTGKLDDNAIDGYLSDIVVWNNVSYKVMKCLDDAQYGFCRSLAIKLQRDVM